MEILAAVIVTLLASLAGAFFVGGKHTAYKIGKEQAEEGIKKATNQVQEINKNHAHASGIASNLGLRNLSRKRVPQTRKAN